MRGKKPRPDPKTMTMINTRLLFALALLPFSSKLLAQVPSDASFFQTPLAGEKAMKECSFDPEASAVILFDKAWAYYNDEGNLIIDHHVRVKILREAGLNEANVEVSYYADRNFEAISNVRAAVWNGDGGPVWMDKKAVFVRKANSLYNIAAFTVPGAAVGSVFEYSYVSTLQSFTGLTKWEFQKNLPVVKSYFQIRMLPMVEFSYTVKRSPGRQVGLFPDQQENTMAFSMDNVPGLRQEPFMDARRDYVQQVNFQLSAVNRSGDHVGTSTYSKTYSQTWAELNNELLMSDHYGLLLDRSLDIPADLAAVVNGPAEPFQKMRSIHDRVRSMMKWNHIYSLYAIDNLRKPWEARTGTATEINLILINLLRSARLNVRPLLVSERDHGKVDTAYPIKDQFTKTVALVDLNGKRYVLDATDPMTPTHIIPSDLIHTRAFLLDDRKPAIIEVPDNGVTESSTMNVMASVGSGGAVTGEATIYDLGYARLESLFEYLRNPRSYRYHSSDGGSGMLRVDTVEVEGVGKDSAALQTKITYHEDQALTGGYLPLRYDHFTGMDKNPFTSETRLSDINFGTRRSFTVNSDFDLDPAWAVESLPQNLKLVSPDQSMTLTRMVRQDGQSLSIVMKFECTRYSYLAAEYDDVRGFYKKMAEVFSEPVMLKKK